MTLREETNLAGWKRLLTVLEAVGEGHGEAPVAAGVKEGEAQAMTVALSTDEVDRHGDIISADGWQLDAYLENPVVLWAHDHRRPPIGRAVQVWREPHRLLARLEFAPTGLRPGGGRSVPAGLPAGNLGWVQAAALPGAAGRKDWGLHRRAFLGARAFGSERGGSPGQPGGPAAAGRTCRAREELSRGRPAPFAGRAEEVRRPGRLTEPK